DDREVERAADARRAQDCGHCAPSRAVASVVRGERAGRVIAELGEAIVLHLEHPLGVLQQRATDCDEVELTAREALHSFVDLARGRAFAAERAGELTAEPDRAYADGRQTRDLLHPTSEVQAVRAVDLGELSLEDTALRAVNRVDAGFRQHARPAL